MNRKRIILVALLAVLAGCLVYAYITMPRLEKATPREVAKRARANDRTADGLPDTPSERINFSYLVVDDGEFPGSKRDIFRLHERQASKPEILPPVVTTPLVQVPLETQVVHTGPVAAPIEIVRKSLSQFTFIGFVEKAGEKTVFLSSGGQLFLVKRGDQFGLDQEFQVSAIDGNILKVSHKDSDNLIEIPLVEQQKLNASVSSPARLPPLAEVPIQPEKPVLNPNKNIFRPAAPTTGVKTFQELIEMKKTEAEQESEQPAEGDAVEGETNGKNQ